MARVRACSTRVVIPIRPLDFLPSRRTCRPLEAPPTRSSAPVLPSVRASSARSRSRLSRMAEVRTVTNLAATVTTVTSSDAPAIGVLALQGGFHEHMVMLSKLGAKVTEVRQVQDLDAKLDGLVVPGGESTTMGHLAERLGLLEPLRAFVASGRPVMGTCAGLIFLANEVLGQKEGGQELVGGLDVSVQRNFLGSQASPPVPPAASRHLELSGAYAAARRAGRFFRDDAERDLRPGARDPRGLHPRACDHAQGR